MIKKTSLTIAALALLLPTFVISAQESKSSFSDFKQEFMPQVGKKITVEGTLESAKLGWLVSFRGWGIYIHANRSADIAKMNLLNKFSENEVSVTGTLQYFPEPKVPPGDLHVAVAPEHFFFDVAEAKVIATQKAARIKETTQKPIVVSAAPAECLTVFRQFFSYVQQSEPSIVRDEHAQIKWLSKNLRAALKQKVASFKDQPNDPDFPGNGTFVGTWDFPTTFTIVGSRRYGNRAVIDVWYSWGKGTNYPGDTRLSYFVFVYEEHGWRLDDVYTFRGEYASAESLNAYLTSK